MKCPLMILADHLRPGGYVVEIGDCLKEECAWWDKDLQRCAVPRIAERLDQITYFMAKTEEREGG